MPKKSVTLSEKQKQVILDCCLNPDRSKGILEGHQDVFPCEGEDFAAWRKAIESHIMSLVNRLEFPSNE
jgi:hypothetical protein